MTQQTPFINFGPDYRPKPCTWAEYAELISYGMYINRKYNVMTLLKACMDWTLDSSECPGIWKILPPEKFSPEEILNLKGIVAVQIISLAYELTENLAATCYAYAEAIDHGVQYFPLLIRDFGLPAILKKNYDTKVIDVDHANAHSFYRDVVASPNILKRYVGTSSMTKTEMDAWINKFQRLSDFRNRFDRWYNKYKHTHATVPIMVEGTTAGQSFKWHLIHRVPDYLTRFDGQVEIKEQVLPPRLELGNLPTIENESFLSAMELVNDVGSVGQSVLNIWQAVRKTQHLKMFGKTPD